MELRNEADRLRRLLRARKKLKQEDWSDPAVRMLPRLEQLIERVEGAITSLTTLEDDLAAKLYGGDTARMDDAVAQAERIWTQTLLDVYCRRFASPDELLLGIYGQQPPLMLTLIECYRVTCQHHGAVLEAAPLYIWTAGESARPQEGGAMRMFADFMETQPVTEFLHGRRYLWRGELRELKQPLASLSHPGAMGMLLRARGPHIAALLAAEGGAHRFRGRSETHAVLVDVSSGTLAKYRPPAAIELSFSEVVEPITTRRSYDQRSSTLDDKVLDRRTGWSIEHSVYGLPRLITEARDKRLTDMLNE